MEKFFRHLLGLSTHKGTLALVDQSIVSGCNFATTIIVGRYVGMEGLGLFSLGVTIVLLCIGLQEALVTQPFTVLVQRSPARLRGRLLAGAVYWAVGLTAVFSLVLAAVTPLLAAWLTNPAGLWRITGVLALTVSMCLCRELARKTSFARLDMGTALVVDGFTATLQILGLWFLSTAGWLTAASSHLIVGLACGTTGFVWLLRMGEMQEARQPSARAAAGRHWSLGKWLLAEQLTWIIHGYAAHWLLALWISPAATGIYTACMTVILISNPFVIGVGNYVTPRLAQVFATLGAAATGKLVVKVSLMLLLVIGSFCLIVCLWGVQILAFVFDKDVSDYQLVVILLAMAVTIQAVGGPSNSALIAIQRTDLAFRGGLAGASINLGLACCLIPVAGVHGAATGFLAGNATSAILRIWMLRSELRRLPPDGLPVDAPDFTRANQDSRALAKARNGNRPGGQERS